MAWLGALAFVASLVCCAWTYGVTWRVAHRAGFSAPALAFDILLFVLFAAHHSIAAREPIKAWIATLVGDRRVRTAYVWLASVLLAVVCVAWRPVGGDLYRHDGVLLLPHLAAQLAGAWFLVESVRLIDPFELAGLRPAYPTPLQTGGPYKVVRHPLYLGWILIGLGSAHMTADRLAFAAISSAYLLAAVPWEERSLAREFGAEYLAYGQRVRWRVIPYVY